MGARPLVFCCLGCLAIFVGGGGSCGKMEFDLIAFTLSPTAEAFERCRKVDLLLIADFFLILKCLEMRRNELLNKHCVIHS